MEKETNVPTMGKEMNFIDLCVVCGRAVGRGIAACGRLLTHMIRLTYRYWWIVLTIMILGIAAALYYTRPGNLKFKVNAIAVLNGPSIMQFEQTFAPLRSGGKLLPDELPLKELITTNKVSALTTYRVIDCLGDSIADYIDFKRASSPTDTVEVQMHDRLCVQFRVKERDLKLIPLVEQDMLTWFNSSEAMQSAYTTYLRNALAEVQFNHSQMDKLDSLTTHYYFHAHHGDQPLTGIGSGVVWVGDWRIHLFLDEIQQHKGRTDWLDQRVQLATAPVVFENHFAVDPKPVNGRNIFLFLFLLLGWIGGCVLAELVDQRKAISAWLKA